jgi:alpha-tubulin suppressor-like RCC1 family protein
MTTQNYSSIKNASIIIPVANTDLGSNASPYGNLFLSGNLTLGNTVASGNSLVVPKISSVSYPNSATAASPAGSETLTINGSGFLTGANVYLANVTMPSASVVSQNQMTFTSPVKTVGSYTLAVINSDGGTATFLPGITYSNVPVFTTSAGTLGTINEGNTVSNTIAATSDSSITYSITSGALPSGLSINTSNGAITGTLSNVSSNTTYNFTVGADDQENQLSTRNFSYTVLADTITWNSPSNNTTYTSYSNSAISNVTLSATSAFGKSITYSANSLPTGLSLTGSNIAGTPTVAANSSTIISATTSTKQANIQLNWSIQTPPPVNAIYSWGYNAYGQLGLGDTTNRSSPTQVGADTNWSVVSLNQTSAGIKTDGTMWAWGYNAYGQLGLGDRVNRSSPVQVGALTTWSKVSTSWYHTVAIKTDGTLWTFGYNYYGALGDGTSTSKSSPVQVGSDTNWSLVYALTISSTLAIKTNGTLWAWGNNNGYALGNGTTNNRSSPIQVGSSNTWSTISGNGSDIVGLKTDGTIWGWGYNAYGMLGLSNVGGYNTTPTQIDSSTNWSKISADGTHFVGIKTNGTMWSCGRNTFYGSLGIGVYSATDTTNVSSPVQIGSDTNWSLVAVGQYTNFAIKTNGTLWTWGYNNNGQLGLGDTTNRYSPVQIGSSTSWKSLGIGSSSYASGAISG